MNMAILRSIRMDQVKPGDVVRFHNAEWDVTKVTNTVGQTVLTMNYRNLFIGDSPIPDTYKIGMTHGARPFEHICTVEYK